MKVNLRDLRAAQPAFQKLMNLDLPIKIAFKLSRIAKAVNDVYQDIERQREALVRKHGAEAEHGSFAVKPENIAVFTKELDDFLNEGIEVDIEPVSLDTIVEVEDIKMSPLELLTLEPFAFKKEERPKTKKSRKTKEKS
jgi:hypothetical protein